MSKPRFEIDLDHVRAAISEGKSLPHIAADMGVGYITLYRRVKRAGIFTGKLTPREKMQIAELRERGLSYGQIALRFGVSISFVQYHCREQGAVHPTNGYMRGRATRGRPFTAEEDLQIQQMREAGMTPYFIERAIGRPHNSVRARLTVLAIREEQELAA